MITMVLPEITRRWGEVSLYGWSPVLQVLIQLLHELLVLGQSEYFFGLLIGKLGFEPMKSWHLTTFEWDPQVTYSIIKRTIWLRVVWPDFDIFKNSCWQIFLLKWFKYLISIGAILTTSLIKHNLLWLLFGQHLEKLGILLFKHISQSCYSAKIFKFSNFCKGHNLYHRCLNQTAYRGKYFLRYLKNEMSNLLKTTIFFVQNKLFYYPEFISAF